MAKLPGAFKSGDHESANYDPIPKGKYPAMITESSMEKCKPTAKDPKGEYLKLVVTVQGNKFKGRKIFLNLNLKNKEKKTVEIAQKQLGDICRAVKKPTINDSAQLHGILMEISVVVEKDNRGKDYPDKNKIIGFYPIGQRPADEEEEEEEEEESSEETSEEEEEEEEEPETEEAPDETPPETETKSGKGKKKKPWE